MYKKAHAAIRADPEAKKKAKEEAAAAAKKAKTVPKLLLKFKLKK